MSVNQYYRQAWITTVYAEAVQIFRRASEANEDNTPLVDLARASANTAFQNHAHQIVGDKETLARQFMKHCRDNFDKEVEAAIARLAQKDIEATQLETATAAVN